jgi:2-succinyl-5-enolpyruvyl-6-hydroxy-3-cyclohexene-1-carboxylate synthase
LSGSVPSQDLTPSAQSAFAAVLFDELARGGMTDVVVCPGSRSTPLVVAAATSSRLGTYVRLDERSAGFFAIGRALATRTPVGVVVTSGTAAAELMAAVVEADLAGIALVVITADRPPELRGVGAPQTIDQVKLYGSFVRRFEDPGTIRPGSESSWRPLAARLVGAAIDRRGPVHLNVPLVEPLDVPAGPAPAGRDDGSPWRVHHARTGVPGPTDLLANAGHVAVVAGRGSGDALVLVDAVTRLGCPLLADPLSCSRIEHPNVVVGFDSILRDGSLRSALRPDTVVLLGAMPASKALAAALADWESRVIAVGDAHTPPDAHGLVSDLVDANPSAWLDGAAAYADAPAPSDFLDRWRSAEAAVQRCFNEELAGGLTEPSVARMLSRIVAPAPLVVSSSMPIRDLEWFGATARLPATVFANRGANGIDGVVSTTLGVAAKGQAVGLLGDLAFLHDAGSLADGVGEHGGRCVLVVVDNHGGGIFSFLPQRASIDHDLFERLFGTPPRVDVAAVAAGYGAEVVSVKDLDALRGAVELGVETPGVTVVVASVPDRDANVEVHESLVERATAVALAAVYP